MNIFRGASLIMTAIILLFLGTAPTLAAKDDVQIAVPLAAASSNQQETNAGDVVADAMREKANADIAFVPADDLSDATVSTGTQSASKVLALLSNASDSSNSIVVLKLTGAQVLKALERSVSRSPVGFSGFLQVSGLQIRYSDGTGAGKRIIFAGTGGSEIDTHKSYRVAVTRPLALGNLGYFEVWKASDISSETGTTLTKSVLDYLAAHKIVNATVEGRIVSAK